MKLFEIMGDPTLVTGDDVLAGRPATGMSVDGAEDMGGEVDEEGPNYDEIVPRLVQMAEENGGFTVMANTFEDANLEDGYQVAIDGYETRADLDDIELMKESVQDINAFVNQQSSDDLYVGGWISDGQLCLDVSQYVEDRGFAISLGVLRGEEAIFDNANMEEIDLTEYADRDVGDVEDEYAPDELDSDEGIDDLDGDGFEDIDDDEFGNKF